MLIKVVGAMLIIAACGSLGFQMSIRHKKSEKAMQLLLSGIEYIQWELQYRMSPLPELLRQTGSHVDGVVRLFFKLLAEEVERQVSPNIPCCVEATIGKLNDLPEPVRQGMVLLGRSLGQFDIDGQISALQSVLKECSDILGNLTANRDIRLRNYQTIALCAGVAVAIIFI